MPGSDHRFVVARREGFAPNEPPEFQSPGQKNWDRRPGPLVRAALPDHRASGTSITNAKGLPFSSLSGKDGGLPVAEQGAVGRKRVWLPAIAGRGNKTKDTPLEKEIWVQGSGGTHRTTRPGPFFQLDYRPVLLAQTSRSVTSSSARREEHRSATGQSPEKAKARSESRHSR